MLNQELFETATMHIHFIQSIGKERREEMGIYALEKECNALVEWPEFMEFIREFVEIPNSEELNWQVLDHQSRMHSGVRLPLGTASAYFLATDHFSRSEKKLLELSSNGMKALIAMLTSSKDVLEILSEDSCTFVRLAAAIRIECFSLNGEEVFGKCASWLDYDPYFPVRAVKKGDIALLDPQLSDEEFETLMEVNDEYGMMNSGNRLLNISDCNCAFSETMQDEIWNRHFANKNSNRESKLRKPRALEEFQYRVRGFGDYFIGTQPFPSPMADYLQSEESIYGFSRTGILSYLKQSIPDQLVINHAGHGVNSYSLNFRFVRGRLAISAQVGWGGVYMDEDLQAKSWSSMVSWLNRAIAIEQSSFQEGYKHRDILVVYSDFRDGLTVEERHGSEWFLHKEIKNPDDLINFLAKNL